MVGTAVPPFPPPLYYTSSYATIVCGDTYHAEWATAKWCGSRERPAFSGAKSMVLAAKRVVFNAELREVFGEIVRVATREDKIQCNIDPEIDHVVVDFSHDGVQYRGLWRQDECMLIS